MEKIREAKLFDFHPKIDNFLDEVVRGLKKSPKEIHCKFFYDEYGSNLFNQICELPEYYPTRTELSILTKYGKDIGELIGEKATIIEYGSGSSRKIRLLLNCLKDPMAYMPIDISKDYLFETANQLAKDYPQLEVMAVCADYTQPLVLPLPSDYQNKKKVIFFPGSTIGNLHHSEAIKLLQNSINTLGGGGVMLIGADLKKDLQILHDAYNDRQGITAEFNLNLLRRINRELGGNFQVDQFAHQAFYNEAEGRIEMHLISLVDQVVNIGDEKYQFHQGEAIHTENSYKYSIEQFHQLARQAGFQPTKFWVDASNLFSVHLLEC